VVELRDEGLVRPVRVAAANDYQLIVDGVAAMLGRFPDQLTVCDRVLVGDRIEGGPIDVVLYDTYGRTGIAADALEELVALPEVHRVAMFSLRFTDQLIEDGRAAGATGFISKALSAELVRDAIVQVASGEEVLALGDSDDSATTELPWPGKDDGLTERESQVLVLVAEGLTNREIAAALYLGTETIKTHVRQILAKLDLRNRVQVANYVARSGAFLRYTPVDPDDVGDAPR
jgi:DNA-binding NarL/FixJ family response regulator